MAIGYVRISTKIKAWIYSKPLLSRPIVKKYMIAATSLPIPFAAVSAFTIMVSSFFYILKFSFKISLSK